MYVIDNGSVTVVNEPHNINAWLPMEVIDDGSEMEGNAEQE